VGDHHVFELPDFDGELVPQIDGQLGAEYTIPLSADLNPLSGGKFQTPPYLAHDFFTLTEPVSFIGEWDNYDFHADLADSAVFSQESSGAILSPIVVNPGNDQIDWRFYVYTDFNLFSANFAPDGQPLAASHVAVGRVGDYHPSG